MEEGSLLFHFLESVALIVDLVGVAIALIGALKFCTHIAIIEFQRLRGLDCAHQMRRNRIELGGYILAAIEFMIVSDILHSVATRALEDLYILVGLVVVRTAISFFLGMEIKELEEKDRRSEGS
ncbi:DUF1622 domain-containing protein [Hyphobacterium sp.]|uniref:DUF1622 domain-containing protein n=1 Tax=Hyphobacterium sp. TaxID=2004662 RepID=UPI003BA8EA0F